MWIIWWKTCWGVVGDSRIYSQVFRAIFDFPVAGRDHALHYTWRCWGAQRRDVRTDCGPAGTGRACRRAAFPERTRRCFRKKARQLSSPADPQGSAAGRVGVPTCRNGDLAPARRSPTGAPSGRWLRGAASSPGSTGSLRLDGAARKRRLLSGAVPATATRCGLGFCSAQGRPDPQTWARRALLPEVLARRWRRGRMPSSTGSAQAPAASGVSRPDTERKCNLRSRRRLLIQ